MGENITTAVTIALHAGTSIGAVQDAIKELPKDILQFPLETFDKYASLHI